ncbi:MAG: hypothetical protein JNK05_03605 [Myxococcales bacterium]|nr:hypothetical protein [Myxococcales bacterium]
MNAHASPPIARAVALVLFVLAAFAACQQGALPSDSSGTTTTQASSGSEPSTGASDPDAGP